MHAEYDDKRLDPTFQSTCCHPSITKQAMHLKGRHYGLIEQEIFLIAGVRVALQDHGRWIAGIDMLGVTAER